MTLRYLVRDVDAAVSFYAEHLGFKLEQKFGPAMAILAHLSGARLWLAGPMSSAAQPMPNGAQPESGGWNRMVLTVADLPGLVGRLKAQGVKFRNEITRGPGGAQILCEDPSGNPIELFEAAQ